MKTVLYVPLDDRPANLDDVVVQGKAAGIHIITPHLGDIQNRLDSEKTVEGTTLLGTSTPTYGKTSNIHDFILKNAAKVDGFIISSDMLSYGGLIGSRQLREDGGGTYPDYDQDTTRLLDVIKAIKKKYPRKPVYVMDTIMRLATTSFADGLALDAYNESRALMQQPRQSFTAFEDIVNGYNLSPESKEYGETTYFNKEHYYNTRQHKFKTNLYMLDQLARKGYIDFLAVGVDDANTQGVQINEINYVEARINEWLGGTDGQNPDRAIILPDADGLGHALVARMANQLLRGGAKTRYAVKYFGPHGSTIINAYEYMDLHKNVVRHVDIVGGVVVADSAYPEPDVATDTTSDVENGNELTNATSADEAASFDMASELDRMTNRHPGKPGKKPVDIEIIAITALDQVQAAVAQLTSNSEKGLPSVLIDFVGKGPANVDVAEALLNSPHTGRVLGYSAWNTPGNKIGMAVGMGQSRYALITTETHAHTLRDAMNAQGSLLFKRFLKDYYYKAVAIADIRTYSRAHALYTNVATLADQNMSLFNSEEDYAHLQTLLRDLMQTHTATLAGKPAFAQGSVAIKQICNGEAVYAEYCSALLEYANPDFIWGRAFEITLNPKVTLN
ncbi:DUF4127 family protein [Paenibacillus sp. UMB7766-LJ446]|uniref:DUF4127 family protein n=1 Tax=Paenibacillus sp. UMB7766-LJ446 TaxID=3046313 RepID=UPI00254F097D|nr:DUF4127 family protein [Paenibacillus sp. UMB7766-LJ446]MDK8191526.1 DUF4127 family protein [Paenibacillus sp. UMB7766-LJ446]